METCQDFNPNRHGPAIIGVFLFVIIIIVVAIIVFYITERSTSNLQNVPVSYEFGSQTPWGSSGDGTYQLNNASNFLDPVSCFASNRTEMIDSKCFCRRPFFGPSCEYQTYNNSFKEIGPVERNKWQLDLGSLYNVNALSFDSNVITTSDSTICTAECLRDNNCKGILFRNTAADGSGKCQLLNSIPAIQNGVDPKYNTNSNVERMYLRNTENPFFFDRVFLFRGELEWRYWLLTNINGIVTSYVRAFPFIVYAITWKPEKTINNAKMTIVVSDNRFDANAGPLGIQGQNWFVFTWQQSLNILPDWSTYYVSVYSTSNLPIFL